MSEEPPRWFVATWAAWSFVWFVLGLVTGARLVDDNRITWSEFGMIASSMLYLWLFANATNELRRRQ